MHNAPMRLFCKYVAQKQQQSREDPIGKAGELLRICFPRQYQYVLRTNPYKKKVTHSYILSSV